MATDDETPTRDIPAAEWRELRAALTERLARLTAERDAATGDAERIFLQRRVDETREQVQTLAVEETVAKFIEDSERYIIAGNSVARELDRDPDEEIA